MKVEDKEPVNVKARQIRVITAITQLLTLRETLQRIDRDEEAETLTQLSAELHTELIELGRKPKPAEATP